MKRILFFIGASYLFASGGATIAIDSATKNNEGPKLESSLRVSSLSQA